MAPNPNLARVPEGSSLVQFVDQEWDRLRQFIYDGQPFEGNIRHIEEAIEQRRTNIHSGAMDPLIDWQHDVDLASFNHRFNLTWIKHHKEIRDQFLDHWKAVTKNNANFLRELALNGMKSMLLIHGGVALGALGVLTQGTGGPQLMLTAKAALGFALIGMLLLGIGQFIMVVRMMSLNSRLEGRLATVLTWKKLSAFGRYFTRYAWPLKYSDRLIYGSILWFGIYAAILYLMLLTV